MRYWIQLATEQFPPSALVEQATEAERAGFDAVNVSDHFQPWWVPGESGMAWALLGAIGQATERVGVGTGVTAPVSPLPPRGGGPVRRNHGGALPRTSLPRHRLG